MAEKEYIDLETAYDMDTLEDWYINSVSDNDTPVWTEEHLEELLNDFYVIPKDTSKADVVPVRHGRWINENFYTCCSVCGNMAIYDKYGQEVESDYCPRCGARMGSDAAIEKPFAILNCPECGGEVDMGKMNFCTGKKSASALFECKKCHYYRNVMTEYTNNPQTALILEWNKYVVSREAYKPVKSAAEEIARNGVPVKQGHWIYADRIFKCSKCDYEFEHEGYTQFFNFCPNCGTKMTGGEGE